VFHQIGRGHVRPRMESHPAQFRSHAGCPDVVWACSGGGGVRGAFPMWMVMLAPAQFCMSACTACEQTETLALTAVDGDGGVEQLDASVPDAAPRRLADAGVIRTVDAGDAPLEVLDVLRPGQEGVLMACPIRFTLCNGECVNTQDNALNCGGCGAVCDDAIACNGVETCSQGRCAPGLALNCDDTNPCTADTCDGVCAHTALPDGSSCQPESLCGGGSACVAGVCGSPGAQDCDDGDPCTTDLCDVQAGCLHVAAADGTSCADGNPCNGGEMCGTGLCTAGIPLRCDDGNPCTAGTCDPAQGCVQTLVADGTSCDDGDACNGLAQCSQGACTPRPSAACDDGNPCTADTCDAIAGCRHINLPPGTTCADADACNGAEQCADGTCQPAAALQCDDGNPCTADLCEPLHGCTATGVADGTSCSDGIACNGEETCQVGSCRQGLPQACEEDGNPCTADICTAAGCEHPAWHDGYPCSDNRACNGQELCMGGACVPGTTPTCEDHNTCTAESCSDGLNRCSYTSVADGTLCDDGDPATVEDVCSAGVCGVGLGTHRVNEAAGGVNPNGESAKPFLSQDGLWVAFQSDANNLVPADANLITDVFVSDVTTGSVTRVSTTESGAEANGASRLATPGEGLPGNAISGDGGRIVFSSVGTNLVAGDTNMDWDVFVKERISGEVTRVSVHSNGAQAVAPEDALRWSTKATLSGEGAISQDGRYVAFSSFAPNLADGDTNGLMDVFRHDLQTGETVVVSISSVGALGNGDSDMPSISADGRCVAFRSLAGNINENPAEPDTNYQYDIYVRDVAGGHTRRITQGFDGSQPNDVSYYPRINGDCTAVTWVSWATNLVPGDSNQTLDVFVRDLMGGPIFRVTTAADGTQANLRSGGPPSINRNGRYIAFYSWATNLVPEDNNLSCNYVAIVNSRNCIDIFIKDLWTGEVRRATLTAGGQQALNNNQDPSLSGNGTLMAFGSYARNLDPDKTSGHQDIFVVRTGVAASP